MINSRNEWDPLEEIVVGSATHANWPEDDPVFAQEKNKTVWKETPTPAGPVPTWLVDEANRELDILAETLVKFGVIVRRPEPMDFVKNRGMYNYCPRDRVLVAGDTIVDCAMMYPCRDQEITALNKIIQPARSIVKMPRDQGLVLDAANIARMNDTWLFLESSSGNRAAYEWLCQQFPKINIEICNFYAGVHIDSTITLLKDGVVILNGSRVNEANCPYALKDWKKIYINDVIPQGFYQYPFASKWIALNMLSIDPETVIVDAAQTELITVLKSNGFDTVPLTLSHSRTLGGGFHCVTLDIRRKHA